MSWFCSGGAGEGRQWGEGVSLSPAYITKLRFIFKQNPKRSPGGSQSFSNQDIFG